MARSSNYNTKQKEHILLLLQEHADQHTTANEIACFLQEQGTPVGMATIYRYLEQLAEEGILRKYTLDAKTGACYQYIGAHHHACKEHFHLKCLRCDRLFHVCCDYLNDLNAHVLAHHGFRIDHTKTVLYGLCEACADKEAHHT